MSVHVYPFFDLNGEATIQFARVENSSTGNAPSFALFQNKSDLFTNEKNMTYGARFLIGKSDLERVNRFVGSIISAANASGSPVEACLKAEDMHPYAQTGRYSTIRAKCLNVKTLCFDSSGNARDAFFNLSEADDTVLKSSADYPMIVIISVTGIWKKMTKMTEKADEKMWGVSMRVDYAIVPFGTDKSNFWFDTPAFRARLLTGRLTFDEKGALMGLKLDSYDAAKRKAIESMTSEEREALEKKKADAAAKRLARKNESPKPVVVDASL